MKHGDLQDILEMWKSDCEIDKMRLDEASRQSPILHAKYLHMLTNAKLMLKKAEVEEKSLLKDKWLYYNGKMDGAAITKRGWQHDPFDGMTKPLKTDMDYFYNADPDIQAMQQKIEYVKTSIDVLKEIIDNIKWRHQNIKNMIEWRKFESGN